MGNLTITPVDIGSAELKDGKFRDEPLTFGSAGTVLDGTILARKKVDDAIVADGTGNTGDGTCTAISVVAGSDVPIVGAYNLECVEAITNGGRFMLVDPNGSLVSNSLTMTAGAGAATVFEIAGMTFTLTDNTTDFIVGDKFSLTVVANGKLVVFAIAGLGGAQFAVALVTYDVVAAGAGDEAIRAFVGGEVKKERLIIDADGDGSNITAAILDQLRDYSIIPIDAFELGRADNS